jgi:hypothetical protein
MAATMADFAKLGLPIPPMAFAVAVLVDLGMGLAFAPERKQNNDHYHH